MDRKSPGKTVRSNSTYVTFGRIKGGRLPKTLWEDGTLKPHQVKYALSVLRSYNYIRKIGKAWETLVDEIPEVRSKFGGGITPGVTKAHTPLLGRKSDTVRLHGMRILVKLPRHMMNWDKRKALLEKLEIDYKPIPQGQRISFEAIDKIWLCKDSIYIYWSTLKKEKRMKEPFSWYGKNADEALHRATNYVLAFIGRLERHLHANFAPGGKYRFRFTYAHYSLIKNSIAKRFHQLNKKFFGFDDTGCWVIIDNSFNLLELEFIHPDSAHDDNEICQGALNDWKKGLTPGVLAQNIGELAHQVGRTSSQLEKSHSELSEKMIYYGEQRATHIGLLQDLDKSTVMNTESVKALKETVAEFAGAVKNVMNWPRAEQEAPKPEQKDDSAEQENEYEMVNVEFLKPNPEFMGIIANKAHVYEKGVIKPGRPIYIEKLTAHALSKNGFVRILI